ncbi:unnamed protein product [Toxocara canis]|nr:unnamed protein product [Toxocara canis]
MKLLEEKRTERRTQQSRLEKLVEEGEQLRRKRNELKMELKNNEIMINNYRNRYNTLSQMRKNVHGDEKEVSSSLASLDEWKSRVNESEKELQSLEAILATANQKNDIVKNDLMTLKPYSEEATELKRMYAEERSLEIQLDEAKSKLRSLQLEKNGEVVFDNSEE